MNDLKRNCLLAWFIAEMFSSLFFVVVVAYPVLSQSQSGPFEQCGGSGWACVEENPFYSQCLQQALFTTSLSVPTSYIPGTTTTRVTTVSTTSSLSATAAGFPASAPTVPPSHTVGKTPALGWNSWNAYRSDCWSPMARNSTTKQIIPDPTKFPNCSQVHTLGLKFGIYSDCYNSNSAIRYCQMTAVLGARIQFNLCLWGNYNVWNWGARVGHSWRLSGDSRALTSPITSIISTSVAHLSNVTFGAYGDMDMMEYTSWIMLKSPILLGTDILQLALLNSTQLSIVFFIHQDSAVSAPATPFTAFAAAPVTSPPEYYSSKCSGTEHVWDFLFARHVVGSVWSFRCID
ncbi:glycoside hydrolase [Mycena crocata]|nr:glycoside hydrolase [Mycena crocata]